MEFTIKRIKFADTSTYYKFSIFDLTYFNTFADCGVNIIIFNILISIVKEK